MITTLLLDIDDTLLDFTKGERRALAKTFARFGLAYRPSVAQTYHEINVGWWARYDRGEVPIEAVLQGRFDDFFAVMGMDCPDNFEAVFEENLRNQHAFVAGAKRFVKRMRKRYRLCAVSNGRIAVQQKRLLESGLDKLLDRAIVSEEAGFHKPEKGFFDYMVKALGDVDCNKCVLIGDSLTGDMASGVTFGCRTVWFNRDANPLPPDCHVDCVARNWRDVVRYLDSCDD